MATSAKCGSTGSIGLGGEILNWTVSLEEDAPEVTSMASAGNREYIPCLKSASGTFESVITCGAIGASAGATFVNDIETLTMDIILTDVSVTTPVDGAVTFKYSFVSTGAVS